MPASIDPSRRHALEILARLAGAVVLVPALGGCGKKPSASKPAASAKPRSPNIAVPNSRPPGWDPIAYNKARGNAGAIPMAYRDEINGPVGKHKHLGKHLPYQPSLTSEAVPEGFIALMWGDPEMGYARHPNAAKSTDKPEGHWYNWIRIRKSDDGEAPEEESSYLDWPGTTQDSSGSYVVLGGGQMDDDGGRNAIYLAKLPPGVTSGDTLRVYAHCLTHGEYVDFITLD